MLEYCSLVFKDEVCLDVDLNYLSFLLPNFFVAYYLNIKQSILVTYMVCRRRSLAVETQNGERRKTWALCPCCRVNQKTLQREVLTLCKRRTSRREEAFLGRVAKNNSVQMRTNLCILCCEKRLKDDDTRLKRLLSREYIYDSKRLK